MTFGHADNGSLLQAAQPHPVDETADLASSGLAGHEPISSGDAFLHALDQWDAGGRTTPPSWTIRPERGLRDALGWGIAASLFPALLGLLFDGMDGSFSLEEFTAPFAIALFVENAPGLAEYFHPRSPRALALVPGAILVMQRNGETVRFDLSTLTEYAFSASASSVSPSTEVGPYLLMGEGEGLDAVRLARFSKKQRKHLSRILPAFFSRHGLDRREAGRANPSPARVLLTGVLMCAVLLLLLLYTDLGYIWAIAITAAGAALLLSLLGGTGSEPVRPGPSNATGGPDLASAHPAIHSGRSRWQDT